MEAPTPGGLVSSTCHEHSDSDGVSKDWGDVHIGRPSEGMTRTGFAEKPPDGVGIDDVGDPKPEEKAGGRKASTSFLEVRRKSSGDLQTELDETTFAREALDAEIRSLRTELRVREMKRDALMLKEVELAQEVAARSLPTKAALETPPSVEDFLSGKVQVARPPASEKKVLADPGEVAIAHNIKAFSLDGDDVEDEADALELDGLDVTDWETQLDAFGVARCTRCGLRFPLEVDAIEKHSKECERGVGPQFGKCHTCGELLPLKCDEIERHLNVCEKRRAAASAAASSALLASALSPSAVTTTTNNVGLGAAPASRGSLWTLFFRGANGTNADTTRTVAR